MEIIMGKAVIKVLAVADPAIAVYVDKKLNVLDQFEEEVQFDVVPWAEYYQTMLEVFAGKAFYDIIMVAGHLWLRDFAEKGYLAPLELEEEDILPVILQEMRFNNKIYLSPSFCDGHMIVYRKSILKEKYGKLFDNVITPDEYIKAATVLGSNSEMAAAAMKAHPSEIFTDALPFLRMDGTDVYDKESLRVTCNNSEVIRGLENYCELRKYAPIDTDTYGNEQIVDAIWQKKSAMAVTWSGQLGVVYTDSCVEKEDLGFTTFNTAWNVTWSFAISANSQNKEKAEKLLRFLRSPQIDKIAGAHSGAPIRRQSYIDGLSQYPWYECQLSMFDNAKPIPNIISAGNKNNVFYEEITNAFAGKKSAKEAMADAEYRINQID
ncbi:MAG: extracellular solute-binding protein [Mobilitalea sp.]